MKNINEKIDALFEAERIVKMLTTELNEERDLYATQTLKKESVDYSDAQMRASLFTKLEKLENDLTIEERKKDILIAEFDEFFRKAAVDSIEIFYKNTYRSLYKDNDGRYKLH